NKLGTLLSSQTTGTSGLLGKTIPNRELSFLFAPLWCFTSIFHLFVFRNSAYSAKFARNNQMKPHENEAFSQHSREQLLFLCGLATVPGSPEDLASGAPTAATPITLHTPGHRCKPASV
ncbi:hypothetical protein, partial [Arthrobacter koreensis]|uniref:hypothetical protein n=1 Tax=Arthrobacter koreensis TaxID=199136 RepID=UPI002DBA9001